MIRPSALNVPCGLAAKLAAEVPTTNEHAERGTDLHAEVARALTIGIEPPSAEARQAVAWARGRILDTTAVHVEAPTTLCHPETGELITEGTPDLVLADGDEVTIVDWKFGRPENVPKPSENWQIISYGLAWTLSLEAKRLTVFTAFPNEEACPVDFAMWAADAHWLLLDEVIRRASLPLDVARQGAWCNGCYQRLRCPAYVLPAHEGPTALAPFTAPGGITADNAERALLAVEAIEDVAKRAKDQLKAWARENGGIPGSDGRVWAGKVETVAAHQRAASTREVFKWRKVRP